MRRTEEAYISLEFILFPFLLAVLSTTTTTVDRYPLKSFGPGRLLTTFVLSASIVSRCSSQWRIYCYLFAPVKLLDFTFADTFFWNNCEYRISYIWKHLSANTENPKLSDNYFLVDGWDVSGLWMFAPNKTSLLLLLLLLLFDICAGYRCEEK